MRLFFPIFFAIIFVHYTDYSYFTFENIWYLNTKAFLFECDEKKNEQAGNLKVNIMVLLKLFSSNSRLLWGDSLQWSDLIMQIPKFNDKLYVM